MCIVKNESLISATLDQFKPISLSEMDKVKLLDRTDTKFMFNLDLLPEILIQLKDNYKVLTISDLRFGRYETRYYDTADYSMYTNHHNGKLNRYKIRFRTYVDSNINFFEIKFKTNKGRTKKSRILYDSRDFKIAGDSQILLEKKTNFDASSLAEAIQVNYSRITLVNNNLTERLTIDFGMSDIYKNNTHDIPNLVIAEVKQDGVQASPFVELMKAKRIKSTSMSKYCLGVATCIPNVKINQFKSKLLYVDKLCVSIA